MNGKVKGIASALVSALFLGMAPIFGKQAILLGFAPQAVVAIRTLGAALMLLALIAVFKRQFIYIFPAGLLGCLLAGLLNGLGSVFYYSALGRLNAGLGQLLFAIYPLFLILWLSLDRQPPTRLTLARLAIALPALILLTGAGASRIDPWGVIQMLLAAALYSLHLPINQRVLFEMPAPTVTVYTLLAMSAVVAPVYLFSTLGEGGVLAGVSAPPGPGLAGWLPVAGLTLVTFFSRLTLFLGVKHLGGMQTALLGFAELLVTVILAHAWLGERFTAGQWVGMALLIFSLLLSGLEPPGSAKRQTGGWLAWITPTNVPADLMKQTRRLQH
jgi:drug/metabolite transporter (DMT)-like permease